jgi:hypothetical protein
MKPELNTLLLLEEKEARIAELEAENARLSDVLRRIATYADPEHDLVSHFRQLRFMAYSALYDHSGDATKMVQSGKEEA